jgi:hypothetical protein
MAEPRSETHDVEFELAPLEAGASLDLRLDIEAASAPASMLAVEAAVALFRSAVEASMFSRGRAASLTTEATAVSHGSTLTQQWHIAGVDAGSWRVLAGLLQTVHDNQTPLRAVRLRAPASSAPCWSRSEVLALPYPSHPKPTPFELWLKHRLAGAKDYLIRTVFDRTVSDREFDRLEASFVTWSQLITHGAFGNERDEVQLDDSLATSQTYLAAPDTLEHEFVRPIGQVGAFAALINLVVGLDRTVARVVRLEIT